MIRTGYEAVNRCVLAALFCLAAPARADFAFVHPGLLHTAADLARMKEMVAAGAEPWKSGFEALRAHPQSRAAWAVQGPFAEIGRAPNVHSREFDQDANAAYQNAIMWQITGDAAHAAKSMEILDAWCPTLEKVTGADAVLMAGLGPFKMVNAAEILRHTGSGWPEASARRCEQMFRRAIYPAIEDFALFANGNWDTAAIKTMVAIGVYTNDRAMFERGLRYYVAGSGNGRLTHYIFETGQSQESGRDQAHTQLGIAHLGDTAEIGWNQGLDLYGWADNRLLKGFEYTARYVLGGDVPFSPTIDRTGKYRHEGISVSQRARLRPVFEQIYNHYVNRRGIPAPEVERAASQIRPEGPAQSADHPGFGTILFSRRPTAPKTGARPSAPAALVARGDAARIALAWVPPVDAGTYTVKRATTRGGPYTTIARNLSSSAFTDLNVKRGSLYYYVVSTSNATGESPHSIEAAAVASLHSPWESADVGVVSAPGSTAFDGVTFTVEGAGGGVGGDAGGFHFAYFPMTGNGTITARFVPPVASQFAAFGLVMRATRAADSRHASLLLTPVPSTQRERPRWTAQLSVRPSSAAGAAAIPEPYVSYGRFMKPYWLRLTRSGDTFTASISATGGHWTEIGAATVPLGKRILAGLAVASRIPGVTTSAAFDNVTYQK